MPRKQRSQRAPRAAIRFLALVAALFVFGSACGWLVDHPTVLLTLVGLAATVSAARFAALMHAALTANQGAQP
jgi:hypothetical protein